MLGITINSFVKQQQSDSEKYKGFAVQIKVYDYSLGRSSDVIHSHACLPIGNGQDHIRQNNRQPNFCI